MCDSIGHAAANIACELLVNSQKLEFSTIQRTTTCGTKLLFSQICTTIHANKNSVQFRLFVQLVNKVKHMLNNVQGFQRVNSIQIPPKRTLILN